MAELAWVPGHILDIESDMSVFHRITDIYSMPGPRFFTLAWRLDCYRGVMRERALAWQREHEDDPLQQPAAPAPRQPRPAPARRDQAPELVTRADLADPVLGKIISFA
jgi:hypothetical protein